MLPWQFTDTASGRARGVTLAALTLSSYRNVADLPPPTHRPGEMRPSAGSDRGEPAIVTGAGKSFMSDPGLVRAIRGPIRDYWRNGRR
ncbi:hypothetical protein GCM10009848_59030 [Micromonospora lupini]